VLRGRITEIGPWSKIRPGPEEQVLDLGESILLPGLVNAHCHLDYTDMHGEIPPTRTFTDWIKSIVTLKSHWSYTEFAQSWINGAQMLVESGTTTVANIEAVPELLPEVWESTPLRVCSFLEMTGVRSQGIPQTILDGTLECLDRLTPKVGQVGLSPHAPYSTPPALLTLAAQAAKRRNWRLTTHLSESIDEYEMFTHARGPLFDWLTKNGRDMSDCGQGSPVQHLAKLGYLSGSLLAIHVNHLGPGDARLLADRKVSVVHCPRSHHYFGHQPFPLQELTENGVNVCLGTDSLVTTKGKRGQPTRLDLFAEMRRLAKTQPTCDPASILEMATCHGAKALGLATEVGELSPGASADLIALPYQGSVTDACAAVVHHQGPLAGSVIRGQWVIRPDSTRVTP